MTTSCAAARATTPRRRARLRRRLRRPGRDVTLGGDFDRASWRDGDGNDNVDGGASRDSLFLEGANAAESFSVKRGRLVHDADVTSLLLDQLEEIDLVAGGGADTVAIADRPGLHSSTSASPACRSPPRATTRRPRHGRRNARATL